MTQEKSIGWLSGENQNLPSKEKCSLCGLSSSFPCEIVSDPKDRNCPGYQEWHNKNQTKLKINKTVKNSEESA
jgi:hypothetical protein